MQLTLSIILEKEIKAKNDLKLSYLVEVVKKNGANCLKLTPFGCGDLYDTNSKTFYGRFEEIGLLEVEAVFTCLQYFDLDVLLGIINKL